MLRGCYRDSVRMGEFQSIIPYDSKSKQIMQTNCFYGFFMLMENLIPRISRRSVSISRSSWIPLTSNMGLMCDRQEHWWPPGKLSRKLAYRPVKRAVSIASLDVAFETDSRTNGLTVDLVTCEQITIRSYLTSTTIMVQQG